MHPFKPHEVQTGYSLDRRKLSENFLHFAQILNAIEDFNIARDALTRQKFKLDAFEETYWNNVDRFTITGEEYVPYSERFARGLSLLTALGSGSYHLQWSCNLRNSDPFGIAAVAKWLVLVPFVDGKLIWQAGDFLGDPWGIRAAGGGLFNRTAVNLGANYHSACGDAVVEISAGKSELGLLAIPLSGNWINSQLAISNLQVVARRKVR